MTIHTLAAHLEPLVKTCALWRGKTVHTLLIGNPHAGGFTQKKLAREHEAVLSEFSVRAREREQQCAKLSFDVRPTERAGHGGVFARQLADEAVENTDDEYLIITAGGDGTSLEVQTALIKAAFGETAAEDRAETYKKAIKERITVIRLPFGTGNDGADGRELAQALSLLEKPAHFALQRAVRVYYTGKENAQKKTEAEKIRYESLNTPPPWYAFNIASIGIDAFITHMTNSTKDIMPGNFYKLWIDLACLFYERSFPTAQAKITAYDARGNECASCDEKILFCLMGVSGHRTYGSDQKILPDDRNVCIAKQMNLVQKLLSKEQFKAGKHAKLKTAQFATAEKLVIEYAQTILTQLDGEVHLLQPSCFPLVFERTEPVIRVVEAEDRPYYKGAEPV